MDFIIMLILFGVISAIGKSNKKQIQNKKTGSSLQQNQRTASPSLSSRPRQIPTTPSKNRESLQDSLTTIFNALAGEQILKTPEEKRREEERAKRIAEEIKHEEQSRRQPSQYETIRNDVSTDSLITPVQEFEDAMQVITFEDEHSTEDSTDFILDLSDVKKGIIWREILDKPLSLRK